MPPPQKKNPNSVTYYAVSLFLFVLYIWVY